MNIRESRSSYFHISSANLTKVKSKPLAQETVEEWMARIGNKPKFYPSSIFNAKSDIEKSNVKRKSK